MSKCALKLVALLAASLPFVGGCASGEVTQIVTDDNQVALDGRPAPGNGDVGAHWGGYFGAQWNHLGHAAHTVRWAFFNTNSENVPYETYFDDQLPRSMYTIGKTIDVNLLNYDWDDPFNGERW